MNEKSLQIMSEIQGKAESIRLQIARQVEENGTNFTEEIVRFLDASYSISSRMRGNVPHEGRALFWVHQKTKQTELLLLLHLLQEWREDIVCFSDAPLIAFLQQGETAAFPKYHAYEGTKIIERLEDSLNQDRAVIVVVPEEQMQRARQVIHLAQKMECPILPVFFGATPEQKGQPELGFGVGCEENLELFPKGLEVPINIGEPIPASSFTSLKENVAAELVLSHARAFCRGQAGLLRTMANVLPPSNRRKLRKEILQGETLGFTEDNKVILLLEYDSALAVMHEIARLRELTFRKIGEGTGLRKDTDRYDRHYRHLLLWDDEELEIVGAYRLGLCNEILKDIGIEGLYSNTLFEYEGESRRKLKDAVECGRSFVQEKYWNSLALDYLWHGIGAFIAKRPEIKYLYGPVSISQSYSKDAREHLIYFYTKWFRPKIQDIRSRNPYRIAERVLTQLQEQYPGEDYKKEFRNLKKNLKMMGFAVPTLYKQYTELCEEGGVQFFDFGVDPDFSNCIDGLIWVNIPKITRKKRERYINNKEHSIRYAPSFLSLSEKYAQKRRR